MASRACLAANQAVLMASGHSKSSAYCSAIRVRLKPCAARGVGGESSLPVEMVGRGSVARSEALSGSSKARN